MNQQQVRGIVAKQAARNILAKQTQFVNEMVHEGLLSTKDADTFYHNISLGIRNSIFYSFQFHFFRGWFLDVKKVEKSRNVMYREQSQKAANNLRFHIFMALLL